MTKVRTCLWFDGNHLEAVQFYTGLIPGSQIEGARRATEAMLTMAKIDIATLEAAYRGA